MESLIQKAAFGAVVLPNPNDIHCMAMPTERFNYTANNERVFLSSGSRPCGSTTYNGSAAAIELVKMLNEFFNKASIFRN
jgi:hypothetical protein